MFLNSLNCINYFWWLVISALFFAVGEFLSKKFALSPSWIYVGLILVAYGLGVMAWLPAMLQKNNLAIVGAIWSVMSLAATVSIGVLVFGESLSAANVGGIIAAFVAVFLLSI